MDLYSLLGLSRTASSAEIERAYRRLSRRYHPGVNPGDRVAEQAYRQIQEAYRVLNDVESRRAYDCGGRPVPAPAAERADTVAFDGFDFSSAAEGPLAATFSELFSDVFRRAAEGVSSPPRGADIELPLRVSFTDAMRGIAAPLSLTRQVTCGGCAGTGRIARPAVVCGACQGQGQQRWARGHMVFTKVCESCGGNRHLTTEICRTCRGAGVNQRTEVVTVHVPAGIETGARIALPGKGHAGVSGSAAGDLYVRIDVGEHPFFEREGSDLHVTVPLGVHEAALGAVIDVPSLDGPVQVRVPPGTGPGHTLRIPGRGIGARRGQEPAGDLVINVDVVMPATLDDRSVALLREFGRLNDLAPARRAFFESRLAGADHRPAE